MASSPNGEGWRPTRTTMIAGALVLVGFWAASWSWWFFLLVGVGAIGPGLLRELGWLDDKDEFQRQADHRAGYHAFLVTALLGFVLVAYFRSGERVIEQPQRLATLFLVLLWFTWFLSSAIAFLGPQRASAWVLRVYGSVVLLFTIVSNLGPEWTGWAALLLHPLLAAPFFLLAWLASRWPRISGLLLLACPIVLVYAFNFFTITVEALIADGVPFILFLGPFLASGITLLLAGSEEEPLIDEEAHS